MIPDCKTCKEHRQNVEPVPYIVHESAMARMERTIRRLWILLILLVVLLVGSNALWIVYESQFEEITTSVEMDNENGYNSYIGNDGDIYNGTNESDDQASRP